MPITQHHTTDRNQSRRNKQKRLTQFKALLNNFFLVYVGRALEIYLKIFNEYQNPSLIAKRISILFFYPVRAFHNSSQWISRLGLSCRLIEYKKNYKFLIGDVSSQQRGALKCEDGKNQLTCWINNKHTRHSFTTRHSSIFCKRSVAQFPVQRRADDFRENFSIWN